MAGPSYTTFTALCGITQEAFSKADGEGFSDEGGFTIMWQFSDGVSGEMEHMSSQRWRLGSLQMDLRNEHHRKAFFTGQVPDGAKLL